MVALSTFRSTGPSFADLVPYAGLVDNGILLLKDGSLMAGWYFAGPDSESATDFERNELARQINAILSRLGTGWMIQVEAVRVPTTEYPSAERSHFPDSVTLLIDDERRRHFGKERGHFESRHALILTYRPPERRRSGLTRYIYSDTESRSAKYADTALDTFRRAIREIEQYLGNVLSVQRMQTREVRERDGARVARYDELFQFIRFAITGTNHPVRLPEIPMYLDWLATAELEHGLTPRVEGRFLGVIAIDGLPAESWPGILNSLNLMPLTYRWSSRFIFLDAEEAKLRLERTRKKWKQKVRPFFDQLFQTQSRSIDQDAMAMVAETEDAIAEASSQLVAYGYYTPVVILFDESRSALREKAESVRRLIQAEGFGARIETLNATDAFLGSLPGNWYCNIREPLINTRNLADLIPLNSVWSGQPSAPCPFYPPDAPPLMQVASGSTPFRLNLHVDDVGHTLIFGPTGSGKSTLLALIAAQFCRYDKAQVFAFDKGNSMLPLTLGVGGDHYEIGGESGEGASLAFCPLSELSTDADRAWASEWIETLVSLQGVTIAPDHRNAISRQIGLMASAPGRSLSDFVSGVQMREIKDALHHYTVDGPMGQLLDAEKDGLTLGRFQCFEIEQLMNMGERNLVPVLTYLFRRIERRLDGSPSLIVPLTLGVGGDHYEIGGESGEGASLAFCPLSELSTDADRAWASEWIETLVSLQGVTIAPDHRNAISRQIGLMASAPGRSLSDFVSGVQMREIKDALHHYTVDGPMGQLLDAEKDGLTLGRFQCFEIEQLMNMGERNLVPVLTYLFRRIERRLDGSPSLIVLDEAWLMLGHPVFRDKIREWLKVLRKANCAVILATQSISDAERSGIIDVLKESCPTKICLPNGAARETGTREFYERIGFNERQIEIVANAIPKREYYVTSPDGRRLFDMSLGPVTLSFVGASGKADLARIRELSSAHGHEWPGQWLIERGITRDV